MPAPEPGTGQDWPSSIEEEFGLSDRKILQTGAVRWLEALEKTEPGTPIRSSPLGSRSRRCRLRNSPTGPGHLSARIAANSLAHPVNSLVARAFAGEPPASLKEVAERYGKLFEDVDKRWQGHG